MAIKNTSEFGTHLEKLLEERGISRVGFQKMMGWENSGNYYKLFQTVHPQKKTLIRIAAALGITLQDLRKYEEK